MTSNSRSELFSKAEIYELQTWANGYLKALDTYLGTKNFVEDDWVEYTFLSGEIVDVLISMDRDEGSPTFRTYEAWACRTKTDSNGKRIKDTLDSVRLI